MGGRLGAGGEVDGVRGGGGEGGEQGESNYQQWKSQSTCLDIASVDRVSYMSRADDGKQHSKALSVHTEVVKSKQLLPPIIEQGCSITHTLERRQSLCTLLMPSQIRGKHAVCQCDVL